MSALEMKESGVAWLGEIPSHWDNIPLHAVSVVTSTRDPSQEPDEVFCYIDVSSICNDTHRISESEQLMGINAPSRARNVVFEGDTIFATVRPYLQNIAQVPIDLDDTICSTGFCVLRPERTKLNSRYLFPFVHKCWFRLECCSVSTGSELSRRQR